MNQLNSFSEVNFTCDSCGEEFQQEVAYSVAQSWEELDENYTYCVNCVKIEEEKPKQKSKKSKSWGSAPVNEISENVQSLNLDGRSLRKTGRVHLFATRMKKEWIERLKEIAYEERKHYNEILEKALKCYERERQVQGVKIISPKIKLPLNFYPHQNFTCDKCGGKFHQETAYSPAPNLKQLKSSPTYCRECV